MPTKNPVESIQPSSGDDRAQRLGHLTDLIEKASHQPGRLSCKHFDAQAIGVAESSRNSRVTLLTVVTRDGKSFQFSCTRAVALATVLKIKDRPVDDIFPTTAITDRVPFAKPNGHLL